MTERNWKVRAEQLPDCENGLWYVTYCEVDGVVGICAKSLDALKEKLKLAIREMIELNGAPEEEHESSESHEFRVAA